MSKYPEFCTELREIALLESAGAVLHWDEQTQMPTNGAAHRADQLAVIARLSHDRFISPRMADLLAAVESEVPTSASSNAESEPTDLEVNARETRRAVDRARKIPASLVEEITRTAVLSQHAWVSARKNASFHEFEPWLHKMLDLKRQEAQCIAADGGPGSASGNLYDALLDQYEPGGTAADIAELFGTLRAPLADLLGKILATGKVAPLDILERKYTTDAQQKLAREAAGLIGFDFESGRLDVSVHPFCTGLGPGDTRLTTRYDERWFGDAFFGTLHECGHGLYEQGVPTEHFGTPRGQDAGLGVHESQSRLWENFVGRSRPFWDFFFPKAVAAFPKTLSDVTMEQWLFAVNDVRPSLIRTEADETTYNLHVLLRFELEQLLLSGNLATADLPDAWNERMRSLLRLDVPNDPHGCLQDVHWSAGLIGYFPTYTLGNIYAAQLYDAARKDLGPESFDRSVAAGDFAPLLNWLREKVHRHGRRYAPRELIRRATGQAPSSDLLLAHLRSKAAEFYGV